MVSLFNYLDILRVGYGDKIQLSNQLLEFQVQKKLHLKYFSFEYQQSYNVELSSLRIYEISYELQKTLEIIGNIPTFECKIFRVIHSSLTLY